MTPFLDSGMTQLSPLKTFKTPMDDSITVNKIPKHLPGKSR